MRLQECQVALGLQADSWNRAVLNQQSVIATAYLLNAIFTENMFRLASIH